MRRYLEVIAEDCARELRDLGFPVAENITYKVNTRAKKRWGQCRRFPGGSYEININAALCDGKHFDGLRETLFHELLHSCPGCMNHGATWKKYAAIVKTRYGVEVTRCGDAASKGFADGEYVVERKTNHILRCRTCGHEYKFARAGKAVTHPEWYHCGKCGGKLDRTYSISQWLTAGR